MILYRNLSFMMRIRALIEGHWSAMRAMLFAVYLWSRRILLASSVWKDSRLASKALLRIHDSAPYRRQGRTQCSIMFLDDRGFSFPRKTPLPLAKKALLAFSMLLSIHFLQERLGHHSAPRHLAELVTGIFSCPAEMCVVLAGVEGEIMASHLLPEQASALISSPNVSTVDGGVHGHRAFVFLLPYIPMVDRGALPRLTLNDAIYVCVHV